MYLNEVHYTVEDLSCPWDYGAQFESENESEWEEEIKKPLSIPQRLQRPGGLMLRSLNSEDSSQHFLFDEYIERMRETFKVEGREDSTIEYVVRTTKTIPRICIKKCQSIPR